MDDLRALYNPDKEAIPYYLDYVKGWLATSIENATPFQIADARTKIERLIEDLKRLNAGRKTLLDVTEVHRRADFALGKSIRKGQAEGTITVKGFVDQPGATPAKDIVTNKRGLHYLYEMATGIEPEQFEVALAEARADGNLSRINVIRLIRARKNHGNMSRQKRANLIQELANEGYASDQMVDVLGVTVESVRLIARDFDIEIPADAMTRKKRRIDYTAAVESAVTELDNWAGSLSFIDFKQVDTTNAHEWVASLTESAKQLRSFTERIRKASHDRSNHEG